MDGRKKSKRHDLGLVTDCPSHSEDAGKHVNGIPNPETVRMAGESTHYGERVSPVRETATREMRILQLPDPT